MSAFRLSELVGKRSTLAIVTIGLVLVVLKSYLVFEPSYEEIYQEYMSIMTQAQEMALRNATRDECAAFNQDVKRRIEPIVEELQELCERRPSLGSGTSVKRSTDLVTLLIRKPLLDIGKGMLRETNVNRTASLPDGPLPQSRDKSQLRDVRAALDAVRGASSESKQQ